MMMAMRIIFLTLAPYLVASQTCDADNKNCVPVEDETVLMQNKIHLHQHAKAVTQPEPATCTIAQTARIIGATKNMEKVQLDKVADLIAGMKCVDWDGDGFAGDYNAHSFAKALTAGGNYISKDGNLARPHYLPGTPANYMVPRETATPGLQQTGETIQGPAEGDAPPPPPILKAGFMVTLLQIAKAVTHFDTVFGGHGWKTAAGSSAQYAELAAADRVLFPPSVTYWMLSGPCQEDDDDNTRKVAEYKNWVSLLEYKAFAEGQCDTCHENFVIIQTDGTELKGDALKAKDWYKMKADDEALKWGDQQ